MISSKDIDLLIYSRGTYFLFEHWNESKTNIYSKAKYETLDEMLAQLGKYLSGSQIVEIRSGYSVTIPQSDGTTLFFKHVNVV